MACYGSLWTNTWRRRTGRMTRMWQPHPQCRDLRSPLATLQRCLHHQTVDHRDILHLVHDLDALAIRTWQRVHLGPQMSMPLREDGITDENLFQLAMRNPALKCRKFST